MLSLRAVRRLGTIRWTRILSPARNGDDTAPEINIRPTNHAISCCYSSKKSGEALKLEDIQTVQDIPFPKAQNQDVFEKDSHSPPSVINIDDLFAPDGQWENKSFAKSCNYLLTDWWRQLKQSKNGELPEKQKEFMLKKLPEIINFVLNPSSPSDLRYKCLVLLLANKTDNQLTSKILNRTVDDAAQLPIRVVVDIIQELTTSFKTPLRRDAREKLVIAAVNQRWYEIPPKDVVFFMYQLDELFNMKEISRQLRQKERHNPVYLSETEISLNTDTGNNENESVQKEAPSDTNHLQEAIPTGNINPPIISINLETRAINLINDFKIKDLARIVILLAKWRNRSETLLNAIVHRLCQADLSDFSFVQLSNLLFSFSVLHVYNDQVLRKIVLQLSQTEPTSPSLACATLASLSHLRWNDEDLVSNYLTFLADHMTDLTLKDAQSVLMSLANLYAVPKSETEVKVVMKLASRVFSGDITPTDKVNCAWCLAIILSLGAEFGESLLQPDFVNNFSDAEDFQKQMSLKKLSSVSTAFQYEVKGYNGPLLHEELLHPAKHGWTGCIDKALTSEFMNTLKKFVDLKTYTKLEQNLKGGTYADAVVYADRSGNVIPLRQGEERSDQFYKVAIQLVPFSGVLGLSQSPAGSYRMSARHLQLLGYVPVQILYSDLKACKSLLEKINTLKAKIMSAIHEVTEKK